MIPGHPPPEDPGADPDVPEDPRADPDVPEDIRYDPDLAVHEPMTATDEPIVPSKRFSPLLLFPLGIVLLSLLIYVLFGLITHEGKRAVDYLDDIRLGRSSAWRSAFEMSRVIRMEDHADHDPRLVPGLISEFERSEDADPRLRRYLALSLGELGDPRAVDALIAALDDPDLEVRLYTVLALGAIGDPRAAEPLLPLLESREPGLRKVTAFTMGTLASPESLEPLRRVLNDPVDDVAWNAALSLARLGDRAGIPLLVRMLDRTYLEGVTSLGDDGQPRPMTQARQEEVLSNALRALALTSDRDHLETVRRIRETDRSLAIRQVAIETLEQLERGPRP